MALQTRIPRRITLVEAPTSRNVASVSAADAAAPYKMLADGLNQVGETLDQVSVIAAERAGNESVQKSEDGSLKIERGPLPIIGNAAVAFSRAARMTYLAQAEPLIENKATEIRLQYQNDPQGFQQAWDSYSKEYAGKADPMVKPAIEKVLLREGGQNYRTALTSADALNTSNALETYKARITDLDNKGAALARQGGTDTAEYVELRDGISTLYGELAKDARFKYPQARVDAEVAETISRHKGQAVIGKAMSIYDKATPAAAAEARRFLTEAAWDPAMNLAPAQRQQIVTMGMAAIEGRTSANKIAVDAHKKLVTETIEALKTSAPYDPRRFNDLMTQSAEMGDVEGYYKLSTYQAFHNWRTSLAALPVPEQVEALRAMRSGASLEDRIIGAESGGNANAKNPSSSATGAGQFIDRTWLDLVKRTRPDIAAGKSDAEVLDLRRNKDLSREMVGRYADQNRQALSAAGARVDNGALYLAHFLGPADAIKVLKAPPGQIVHGLVTPASIEANASIFNRNPTAAQMVAWAERKVGSTPGGEVGISPIASPWVSAVRQEMVNDVSKSMASRADGMVSTLEAAIGKGRRPADSEIADIAAVLLETGRHDLIERVDGALATHDASQVALRMPVGAREAFRAQMAAIAGQGGDARQRRVIDSTEDAIRKVEEGMKKTPYSTGAARGLHVAPAALNFDNPASLSAAVTQRRAFRDVIQAHDGLAQGSIFNGDAEEKAFQGRLMSNDPKQVAVAAGFASSLLADDPNAFGSVAGRKAIEDEAVAFRHYVDDLGMNAEQAAAKLIVNRDPEYQGKIKARVKNEDVDALLKKKLDVSDLRGAFDDSFLGLGNNPQIGFTPGQRDEMFRDYAELTKDYYLDGHGAGDLPTAQKLAQRQLKIVWGASNVSGAATVMRYPPEKAPGIDRIPNASDLIADDAMASITTESGQTVARGKIALMPIAGATASAFKSGQPVPYQLLWQDADGVPRTLNPGRVFMVDAKGLRDRQSAARGAQYDKARGVAEVERLIDRDPRLPFGVP
jgi:hypothetical protein